MGLDQYAKWTDGTQDEHGKVIWTEFKYWRKTSHIQHWMQKLHAKKTGVDKPEDFNCVDVELTEEDIQEFVSDVKNNKMQCTSGCFFGYSYDTQEEKENDLDFASQALKHVWMGRKVIYRSWW